MPKHYFGEQTLQTLNQKLQMKTYTKQLDIDGNIFNIIVALNQKSERMINGLIWRCQLKPKMNCYLKI